MNKKFLALLLVTALTVSLAVPALADEYPEVYHCECGAKQYASASATEPEDSAAICKDGCSSTNLTWKPLATYVTNGAGKHVLPSDSANYYLVENIEVDYPTYLGKTMRIDLNGHTIFRPTHKIIQVEQGGSLVITDTSTAKNGCMDVNAVTAGNQLGNVISVVGGSLKLLGGTLDASGIATSPNDAHGGAVNVESSGSFAMYDGVILGGKVCNGGAIYVKGGSAVTVNGGIITGSTVKKQGGAIFTTGSETTLTMNGGTIFAGDNVPDGGSAVMVVDSSTFTMNGGEITAAGKTGSYGMCVCAYSGTFNLYDGTLTGGTATGSGGGVMSLADGGKVNMYGGTIQNGTHNNTETAHGGGNVRVSSGCTLNMYGGTITGGTATNGQGGGVYVLGTLLVAGDARITGNTGSNVWLGSGKTITLGTPALTANASIGITMQTPGTFVSSGASEANFAHFYSDNSNCYFNYKSSALTLTNDPGNNTAAIGSGLYATIADAAAAITNRDEQSVKVVKDTNETVSVTGNLYLDLNGKTLSGSITVNNGELKVFDSKTADYDVSDGFYGKITGTVTGEIARSFVNPDNQRYLVVKTTEGYSAHRIYLAVTHSVIDSENYSAMNYKTVLKCDEVIANLVSDYGVTVRAEKEGTYSYFQNGTTVTIDAWDGIRNNEKTTKIENFLMADDAQNENRAETPIKVKAYITLTDENAGNITSAEQSRSLKEMIENALSQWDTKLTVAQKKTLKKMYDTYNTGFMDDWTGIEKVKGFDGASQNSITSVGYAAVNIDPTSDMYGRVGLMGFGNEADRKVTGVDSNAPLMAICLAVTDQDGNTVLLISVDSASVSDGIAKKIVRQISENYGVPAGNIMISSNHQHSTPVFGGVYDDHFVNQVVDGARQALADRKEVIGMFAQIVEVGENTFNFVRNVQYTDWRGNPIAGAMLTDNHDDKNRGIIAFGKTYESIADDDVQLVKITRVGDEQPIVLANFQTHPNLSTSASSKIATADMIGVFRNQLAKELNCKPMYFTGASGNINAWSGVDTSKEKTDLNYVTQGQSLAKAVSDGIKENAWESVVSESTGGVEVKTVTQNYSVMLNTVPTWLTGKTMEQIVTRAAQIWNSTTNSYLREWNKTDLTSYGIYSIYHAKYIVMRSTNKATDTKSLTISAIAIGDLAFVVVPYEMYDTNGMQIKAASPYKMTFVTHLAGMAKDDGSMSLANGYIPSQTSYNNGGYSVDIAQYAAGTGEKLAQDYIYILNELYQ